MAFPYKFLLRASIPRKLSRRSRVGVAGTRDQATVLHWLLSSLDSRRSNQRYASAPMMSLAVRRGGPLEVLVARAPITVLPCPSIRTGILCLPPAGRWAPGSAY